MESGADRIGSTQSSLPETRHQVGPSAARQRGTMGRNRRGIVRSAGISDFGNLIFCGHRFTEHRGRGRGEGAGGTGAGAGAGAQGPIDDDSCGDQWQFLMRIRTGLGFTGI